MVFSAKNKDFGNIFLKNYRILGIYSYNTPVFQDFKPIVPKKTKVFKLKCGIFVLTNRNKHQRKARAGLR